MDISWKPLIFLLAISSAGIIEYYNVELEYFNVHAKFEKENPMPDAQHLIIEGKLFNENKISLPDVSIEYKVISGYEIISGGEIPLGSIGSMETLDINHLITFTRPINANYECPSISAKLKFKWLHIPITKEVFDFVTGNCRNLAPKI